MEIVQATKNDLSELCIFYEKVCEQQKFDKYSPDWHWGQYPCRDDLEYAIAEGATIVRVGSAIFGERDFK